MRQTSFSFIAGLFLAWFPLGPCHSEEQHSYAPRPNAESQEKFESDSDGLPVIGRALRRSGVGKTNDMRPAGPASGSTQKTEHEPIRNSRWNRTDGLGRKYAPTLLQPTRLGFSSFQEAVPKPLASRPRRLAFEQAQSGDDLSESEDSWLAADEEGESDFTYLRSSAKNESLSTSLTNEPNQKTFFPRSAPDHLPLIASQEVIDWLHAIGQPMLSYSDQRPLSVSEAVDIAIRYAPEIEVVRAETGIRRSEITRQQAEFDWNRFVELTWDETSLPISSTLDGANDRLRNQDLVASAGLGKVGRSGGRWNVRQGIGFSDSNSQFFQPRNQANAILAIELTQPLLQGAGVEVNTALIRTAQTDAMIGQEQFVETLQNHATSVITAYWELFQKRGEYLVARRSHQRAQETARVVNRRTQLDVSPVQQSRANATLAARHAAMIGTELSVVLAQEKLLRLMYGAQFNAHAMSELLPVTPVDVSPVSIDMDLDVHLAMQNRPEIRQSINQIKIASIQQGVAQNRLLPLLGLTLSVSNRGLRGDRQWSDAFVDQWNTGEPTFGVGFEYELPVGNRAARSNHRQTVFRINQRNCSITTWQR